MQYNIYLHPAYLYSLDSDGYIGGNRVRELFTKPYLPYSTGKWTCVSAINGEPYSHVNVFFEAVGTVYDGTLDVSTGELVVDRAMVDLGTLTWNLYSSSFPGLYYSDTLNNQIGSTDAQTTHGISSIQLHFRLYYGLNDKSF